MRVGTKACQSDGVLLGEQANGAALFGRYAWAVGKRMFMKFSIASCYCGKKMKYSGTFASQEYYFISAPVYSSCNLDRMSYSWH